MKRPELKVGWVVLAAAAALLYMTGRLTRERFEAGAMNPYYTILRDASGLIQNSKIRVAGLSVGRISEMRLQGNRALIQLEIDRSVDIRSNASVSLKTIGYLGDRYISVDPGSEDQPPLEVGALISAKDEGYSLEQMASRLEVILKNLEKFSSELAQVEDLGEITEAAGQAVDQINTTASSVGVAVSRAEDFKVYLDFRGLYLADDVTTRNDFSLILRPSENYSFLLGASYRPQPPEPSGHVGIDAQLARRVGPVAFRLGLFEGTGGLGIDVSPLRERIRVFGELYRFRPDQNAQLNLGAEWVFHSPFYAQLGGDFVTSSDEQSFFIGAGIRLKVLDVGEWVRN